jgi:hypothetical protein
VAPEKEPLIINLPFSADTDIIVYKITKSRPEMAAEQQKLEVDDDVLEYMRRLVLGDDQIIRRFRNLVSTDYNRLLEKCLRLSRYRYM